MGNTGPEAWWYHYHIGERDRPQRIRRLLLGLSILLFWIITAGILYSGLDFDRQRPPAHSAEDENQ